MSNFLDNHLYQTHKHTNDTVAMITRETNKHNSLPYIETAKNDRKKKHV